MSLAGRVRMIRQMPGLEVRFSEPEDGAYWSRWLCQNEVLKWYPMETDEERVESVERMKSVCQYKAALTAIYQGEVAGIAYLNPHPFRKIAHQCLFTIIVDEKWRGKGIGKELLTHLERLAKDSFGIEWLHLEVYEGNPAIRLYRRMGYEECGFQAHWIREGEGLYRGKIFMAKRLKGGR